MDVDTLGAGLHQLSLHENSNDRTSSTVEAPASTSALASSSSSSSIDDPRHTLYDEIMQVFDSLDEFLNFLSREGGESASQTTATSIATANAVAPSSSTANSEEVFPNARKTVKQEDARSIMFKPAELNLHIHKLKALKQKSARLINDDILKRHTLENELSQLQNQSQVEINVGGHIFRTTVRTLCCDPDSMLCAMFHGRFQVDTDSQGRVFIDRDGRHFHLILNFLRTGVLHPPECVSQIKELLLEAEFYNIDALVRKLRLLLLMRPMQQCSSCGNLDSTNQSARALSPRSVRSVEQSATNYGRFSVDSMRSDERLVIVDKSALAVPQTFCLIQSALDHIIDTFTTTPNPAHSSSSRMSTFTILIKPGVYKENIVIPSLPFVDTIQRIWKDMQNRPSSVRRNLSLHITGSSDGGAVVECSNGFPAMTITNTASLVFSGGIRISNLRLIGAGSSEEPCVAIGSDCSAVTIEHCDISTQGENSSCIEITLPVAGPVSIVGNEIHHSNKIGISVSSSHSLLSGVMMQQQNLSASDPDLPSSCLNMNNGGRTAHSASGSHMISIEFNNLFCNNQSIVVEHGATPVIRHNNIFESKRFAVRIAESSGGLIEHNNIFSNHRPSIIVDRQSSPLIRRNRVHDGLRSGIWINVGGFGVIEENDIFSHANPNIIVDKDADPVIRRNKIHDGRKCGIWIRGQGLIEGNDIYRNTFVNVDLDSGSDPVLHRNTIREGTRYGVTVGEQAHSTISSNTISFNRKANVKIKAAADPIIVGNTIHNSRRGIVALHDAKGVIRFNTLFNHHRENIKLGEGTTTTLEANTFPSAVSPRKIPSNPPVNRSANNSSSDDED